jgi:hypothetical protein
MKWKTRNAGGAVERAIGRGVDVAFMETGAVAVGIDRLGGEREHLG